MLGTGNISIQKTAIAAFVAVSTASFQSAHATNGMFMYGFGPTAKGMAGAGAAYSTDSLAPATNPAGSAFVGTRSDIDVTFFAPDRWLDVSDDATFNHSRSAKRLFTMPNIGVNYELDENHSVGFSLQAMGGMATHYKEDLYRAYSAFGTPTAPTGLDLAQTMMGLNYAYKIGTGYGKHAFGVTPYFAAQRFRATGLEPFASSGISTRPDSVTAQGWDYSYGFGGRVGYQGRFLDDRLMIGASYQSRSYMTQFTKYEGLFAEGGDLDIPPTAQTGIAYKVTPDVIIAVDYQWIGYNDVRSIANSRPKVNLQNLNTQAPQHKLGAHDGWGFGWHDMNIVKVGIEYQHDDKLTLRGGVSHNSGIFDSHDEEMLFNIPAPGVVRTHVTVGASYQLTDALGLNFSFAHALEETLRDTDRDAQGTLNLTMKQFETMVGLSYAW